MKRQPTRHKCDHRAMLTEAEQVEWDALLAESDAMEARWKVVQSRIRILTFRAWGIQKARRRMFRTGRAYTGYRVRSVKGTVRLAIWTGEAFVCGSSVIPWEKIAAIQPAAKPETSRWYSVAIIADGASAQAR